MPINPDDELAPRIDLATEGLKNLIVDGFESIKCRLQLSAADEFTIIMPAQDIDGTWLADLPQWQVGGTIYFSVGWNNDLKFVQVFEIVSTTVAYSEDEGGEKMTVRAVSDLVRAARNKKPRTFGSGDTFFSAMLSVCNEYGWSLGLDPNGELENQPIAGVALANNTKAGYSLASKKSGESDLNWFKNIAQFLRLGGPRLDKDKVLQMPKATVGDLVYARGLPESENARSLHKLSMNRDGGESTRLRLVGYDPTAPAGERFVIKEFEADKFNGDPAIAYEGRKAEKPLELSQDDVKNMTLAVSVVEHRKHGKEERIDVIASGKYKTDLSMEEFASRYFETREKLGRWATVEVDGNSDLLPYESVTLEGALANVDRGVWLPVWVEHVVDAHGWNTQCRVIRVVEEPPPLKSIEPAYKIGP